MINPILVRRDNVFSSAPTNRHSLAKLLQVTHLIRFGITVNEVRVVFVRRLGAAAVRDCPFGCPFRRGGGASFFILHGVSFRVALGRRRNLAGCRRFYHRSQLSRCVRAWAGRAARHLTRKLTGASLVCALLSLGFVQRRRRSRPSASRMASPRRGTRRATA